MQMQTSEASHAVRARHEYLELASSGNTMVSTGPTGPAEAPPSGGLIVPIVAGASMSTRLLPLHAVPARRHGRNHEQRSQMARYPFIPHSWAGVALGSVWGLVIGHVAQTHAGSLIPTTKEKDAPVNQHSREVIGDERSPDEREARPEDVREEPRQRDAETPVSHGRADEGGDRVACAPQDARQREVRPHEGLGDG